MKNAIGLVAVRMKSDRLKEKALADLAGKPLIVRLYERVRAARRLDDVVLCTSTHPQDDAIEKVAREYGMPLFRGDEKDVMKRFLDCLKQRPARLAVRITGDNPLTDPENIDAMIASHEKAGADYTRTDNLPAGCTAEVITTAALQRAFELAEDSSHSEYMTWYFTKTNVFKLNVIAAPAEVSRPKYRLTVDFDKDLELLRSIYTRYDFDLKPPRLAEVIRYLDDNPELAEINRDVPEFKATPEINTRLRTVR